MALMTLMGVMLLVGVVLTVRWGGTHYETWDFGPGDDSDPGQRGDAPTERPSVRAAALRYLRGVAIALAGGFWAGALVTGPAMRLIMRLLAATAGDRAQRRITEAGEVVGEIDVDGTIGLIIFGGILPGLLSGAIYVVFRRWLPDGRLGGVTFGLLHLVLAATRIDPLRPDNRDFDLVGPGWLSVVTFGLASVVHGMAVVAIANRFSTTFPTRPGVRPGRTWPAAITNRFSATFASHGDGRAGPTWRVAPLVPPAMALLLGFPLLLPIVVGLAIALATRNIEPLIRVTRGRAALLAGRVAVSLVAVALLPGTIADLSDIIG